MDAESLRERIAGGEHWEARGDGWWLVDPELDVRRAAITMTEAGARLSTITARPMLQTGNPNGSSGYLLYYHWDLGGQMLTVGKPVRETVPSIVDLCPAADWVEREVHDYFGIRFAGRESLPPLVTRDGDPPVFALADERGAGNGSEPSGGPA